MAVPNNAVVSDLYVITDEFDAVLGYLKKYGHAANAARGLSEELVSSAIQIYGPVGDDGKRTLTSARFFRGVWFPALDAKA